MNAVFSINKISIIYKPNVDLSYELGLLCDSLRSFGIDYEAYENTYEKLDEKIFSSSDLIISLGGDGNLISVCKKSSKYRKPVLGVYAGHLGFLTEIEVDEFDRSLREILSGQTYIKKLFMLQVSICKNGKTKRKLALNDVVLSRKSSSMASIIASIDDKTINTYHADGLIISTPAGSTAYNMSAGGSIIYPHCEVFEMTPICSHSLSQRPIILPRDFIVRLSTDDCMLSIDGQEFDGEFEYVKVGLSSHYASLIAHHHKDYFDTLKRKLHWGQ